MILTEHTNLSVDWPYDRSTLMAIRENSITPADVADGKSEKVFKARIYRHNVKDKNPEINENSEDGHELYLGKMIMEKEGSLLIIGGKGDSGSIRES
jgi:hypothetical protein